MRRLYFADHDNQITVIRVAERGMRVTELGSSAVISPSLVQA